MVVLVSSGGPTVVAPMLFTSQLTLSLLVAGCSLGRLSGVSSDFISNQPQTRLSPQFLEIKHPSLGKLLGKMVMKMLLYELILLMRRLTFFFSPDVS